MYADLARVIVLKSLSSLDSTLDLLILPSKQLPAIHCRITRLFRDASIAEIINSRYNTDNAKVSSYIFKNTRIDHGKDPAGIMIANREFRKPLPSIKEKDHEFTLD